MLVKWQNCAQLGREQGLQQWPRQRGKRADGREYPDDERSRAAR